MQANELGTNQDTSQEPAVLEATPIQNQKPKKSRKLWYIVLPVLMLILFGGVIAIVTHTKGHNKSNSQTGNQTTKSQAVDLDGISSGDASFSVSDTNKVVFNGQVQATQGLVIQPTDEPTSPTTGQIYLDASTKQLRYYNGEEFITLGAQSTTNTTNDNVCNKNDTACGFGSQTDLTALQAQLADLQDEVTAAAGSGVTSLQSLTGAIGVSGTNGISVGTSGNNITLGLPSLVNSLQGLTGDITFSGTNGLTVSNTGNDLSFDLPQGLTVADSPTFAGLTINGTINTDSIQSLTSGASITFDGLGNLNINANGRTYILPTSGGTSQTICTTGISCASGGGQAVLLQPGSAQTNNSNTDASIFINNTGTANILQLQSNGSDVFVVDSSGAVVATSFSGDGSGLTNLNASNIASGTLSDLRLSPNVALLDRTGQTFTSTNIFQTNSGSPLTVQGTGAANLLSFDSSTLSATLGASTGSGTTTLQAGSGGISLTNNTTVSTGKTLTVANGATSLTNSTGTGLTVSNGVGSGNIATFQSNSTTVFNLASGGAASFQNSTNSATAFNVQNATGGQLFNIDSTNSVITLNGNNTGELQAWSTTTALSTSTKAGAVSTNGSYLYKISGIEGSSLVTTSRYARINADGTINSSWSTTTAVNAERSYPASITSNGFIYLLGGFDSSNAASTTIQFAKIKNDGTLGSWTTSENQLGTAVGAATAVVANGYIYVIGGATTSTGALTGAGVPATSIGTVQYAAINADGSIGAFSTTNALPGGVGRMGGRAILANGYIYFTGGQNSTPTSSTSVYYATPASDGTLSWSTSANSLGTARAYHGIAVQNGYLYAYGGGSSATSGSSSVEYAPLNGNGTIGSFTTAANAMVSSTVAFGFANTNGYLYAVGGQGLSSVQYASGARIRVGGSLDLVGIGGENLASGRSGGTLTAGNTTIVGTLQVADYASFLQGASVDGDLFVGGHVAFKNSVDSELAIQVQNSSGGTILKVDTVNNLIQPGFSQAFATQNAGTVTLSTGTDNIDQGLSIAIGSDGKPIVAGLDTDTGRTIIFKCKSITCNSVSNPVSLGSAVNGGRNVSMTTGTEDGLPIIASRILTGGGQMEVTHCGNLTCDSGNKTKVLDGTNDGFDITILMGGDRRPIMFYRLANNTLRALHCGEVDCMTDDSPSPTSNVATTISTTGTPGHGISATLVKCAVASQGTCPVIAHVNTSGATDDLQISVCANSACTSLSSDFRLSDPYTDLTGNNNGTGITTLPDGTVFVVFPTGANELAAIHCKNLSCTSSNIKTVAADAIKKAATVIQGKDGNPLIFYQQTGGALRAIQCANYDCTSQSSANAVSGAINDSGQPAVVLGRDGLPIIASGTSDPSGPATGIYVSHCVDSACSLGSNALPTGGVSLGSSTLRFSGLFVDSINDGYQDAHLKLTADGNFYANTLQADNTGRVTIQSTNVNAFRVLNGGTGQNALNIDSTTGQLTLGATRTSIPNNDGLTGSIKFFNATDSFSGTLVAPTSLTGNRTYTLPNASGVICLDSGNCNGAGGSLQTAYTNSQGGATPEIKLNSANKALDIQDDDTTINGSLFNIWSSNTNITSGTALFSINSTGQMAVQNSTDSATALTVKNAAGNSVFAVDTTAGSIKLGSGSGVTGKAVFSNSSNTNTVTLQSGTTASDLTFTLPTADGSPNQCLKTDGSGNFSFANCIGGGGGGGGGVVSVNGLDGTLTLQGTTNQINVASGSGTITLSTPQDIATTSNVNFNTLTTASNISMTAGNFLQGGTGTFGTGSGAVSLNGNVTVAAAKTLTVTSGATTLTGASTGVALTVNNSTSTGNILNLQDNGSNVLTVADGGAVTATGSVTINRTSTTALSVVNTGASVTAFVVDSSNALFQHTGKIGIGTANLTYSGITFGNTNNYSVARVIGVEQSTGGFTGTGLSLTAGTGGPTSGAGGDLVLTAGAAGGGAANGGQTAIYGGNAVGFASGGALTLQSGAGFASGIVTIDSGTAFGGAGGGAAINIGTTNSGTITIGNINMGGGVTINSGTGAINIGTSAGSRSINIGTGASGSSQSIIIGSIYSGSSIILNAGTGGINIGNSAVANSINIGNTSSLGGAVAQTINIGRNTTASSSTTVNIGNIIGTSPVTIQAGTSGISFGTGGIANTLQIGNTTGAVAQTINIGNNTTASSTNNVVIGSTIGTSTTTLNAGSGNVNVNANTDLNGLLGVGNTGSIFTNTGVYNTNSFTGTNTCLFGCYGYYSDLTIGSGTGTVGGNGYWSKVTTAAAVGVLTGMTIDTNAISGSGSATNNYGLLVNAQSAGTTNYGIKVGVASGALGYGIAIDASTGAFGGATLWVSSNTNSTTAKGGIAFGSSTDTNLYRSAADTLKTDDTFESATGLISPSLTGSTTLSLQAGTNINVGTTTTGNINIGNTTTGSLTTQTISIGTTAQSGSIATIVIGSQLGASSTTIQSGTGNINIGAGSTGNVVIKNVNNGTSSFTIQNSSGTSLLIADTTNMRLTVKDLVINGSLTVNGHVISGNASGTTTIAAGAAACTTPTVSVAGNDTAGTITIVTGTGCGATGVMGTVTFAGAYGSAPRIVLTPAETNAATIQYYNGTTNTTTFTLDTNTATVDSTTYKYNYWVAQ